MRAAVAFALLLLTAATPLANLSHAQDTAREVRSFNHGSYIRQLEFSVDGKYILTDDKVWELATGKVVCELSLPPVKDRPSKSFLVAFAPNSRHVAVHRYDVLLLSEIPSGKEVWKVALDENTRFREDTPRLAFTPDGKHLLAARNDEALVRVWDVSTGKQIRSFPFDSVEDAGQFGITVQSLLVSADGKRVVVHRHGSHPLRDGPVILDFATGKELRQFHCDSPKTWIHYSAPSPAGNLFAFPVDSKVQLLDLETGILHRTLAGAGQWALVVAYSPTGKHIAASIRPTDSDDDWVQVWEIATGKSIAIFKGHQRHISTLVFSPDGKLILSGGDDQLARLWRLTE